MEDQLFGIAESIPFHELWLMLLGYLLVIVARQAGDSLRYLFECLNALIINRRDITRSKNVDYLAELNDLKLNLEEKDLLIQELRQDRDEDESRNN